MANDKKFVVKNGLRADNVEFTDSQTGTNQITLEMLNTDTLNFEGDAGSLFSITDDLTGSVFSVGDISGIPIIEVNGDTHNVTMAEFDGKVMIGGTDSGGTDSDVLNVTGNVRATAYYGDGSNLTGISASGTDSATVSSIITADVDKAFVDALNVDADTLDGINSTSFLRSDADNTVNGNLTFASGKTLTADSATFDTVTADVYKFGESFVKRISADYAPADYLVDGEYQEILRIVPGGASKNYTINGRIVANGGANQHTIYISAAVRSNTLPDLAWTATYNSDIIGTTEFMTPRVWAKETTTAGWILVVEMNDQLFGRLTADLEIIARSASDLENDITVNTTEDSEVALVESGFTQYSFTKTFEIDNGTYALLNSNSEKLVTTSSGVSITGTATATTFSGSGASLTNLPAGQLTGSLPAIDGSALTGISVATDSAAVLTVAGTGSLTGVSGSFDVNGAITADSATLGTINLVGNSILTTGTTTIQVGTNPADGNIHLNNGSVTTISAIRDTNNPYAELNYGGSSRLTTDAYGVDVTGRVNADSASITTINIPQALDAFANEGTINLGSTSKIYHNTSGDLTISNVAGSSGIQLRTNSTGFIRYLQSSGQFFGIKSAANGATKLYYGSGSEDGTAKKIETTATGVDITGTITSTDSAIFGGNGSTGGVKIDDGAITIRTGTGSVAYVDFYCEVSNAHRTRLKSAAHSAYSGNVDVTLPVTTGTLALTSDIDKTFIDALNVDADTLDGINSTSFLRSDAAATKTSGDLTFNDNVKAVFGTGGDLEIYHTGTNSLIADVGIGPLQIRSDDLQFIGYNNEQMASFAQNGGVELYHNDSAKFETTATGVTVTGTVAATAFTGDGSALTGISSGGGVTVQDEGSALSTTGTVLNFVGAGVVASGTGSTKTITIAGGGSGVTVQDEGSSLTTAGTTLNFVGAGVTASGTGATKTITISGGGGGGSAADSIIRSFIFG